MPITIRNEQPGEQRSTEELTRLAFWNQHEPGCNEHFLAHKLRQHPDFVSELNLVAVRDDEVVGNIMFTKSWLVDEKGNRLDTLTFGPLSVRPDCQRRGIGKALVRHATEQAVQLGYPAIVIWGDPNNYCGSGFRSCKEYQVSVFEGRYPCALLVNALRPEALEGRHWAFEESEAYHLDNEEFAEFDKGFEPLEKGWQSSQEVFRILSQAFLDN